MVLAVEPMVTAGRHAVRMGDDDWAIYSQDGSLAAHFEFTIAVTADGPADPHPLALSRLLIGCIALCALGHVRRARVRDQVAAASRPPEPLAGSPIRKGS